jgi:hypothetical protein
VLDTALVLLQELSKTPSVHSGVILLPLVGASAGGAALSARFQLTDGRPAKPTLLGCHSGHPRTLAAGLVAALRRVADTFAARTPSLRLPIAQRRQRGSARPQRFLTQDASRVTWETHCRVACVRKHPRPETPPGAYGYGRGRTATSHPSRLRRRQPRWVRRRRGRVQYFPPSIEPPARPDGTDCDCDGCDLVCSGPGRGPTGSGAIRGWHAADACPHHHVALRV